MSDTIISSLISGGVAVLVCALTQWVGFRKTQTVMEFKLEVLTKKVEKHNNLIERTYKLEEQNALQEQRLDTMERNLHELTR